MPKVYVCYHCGCKMQARHRPDKCVLCGKISHEDQREKFSEVPAWQEKESHSQSRKHYGNGVGVSARQSLTDAPIPAQTHTTIKAVREGVEMHWKIFGASVALAMIAYIIRTILLL